MLMTIATEVFRS